jgi:dephospho-CoA kinase
MQGMTATPHEEGRRVLVVGLTGGLGSGKSTVASMLSARGFAVIDTDRVGHELLNDPGGDALAAVANAFGTGILAEDGRADRSRLAERVFQDPAQRRKLEAILHPAIARETWRRVQALAERGERVVVLEVPLLVEAGWDRLVDLAAVVDCDEETQVARFMARTGATREEAARRLSQQADRRARRSRADFVVDNSRGPDALAAQVDRLADWLRAEVAKRWEGGGT